MKKTVLIGMMAFLCAGSMFAQRGNVNRAMQFTTQEGMVRLADVNTAKEQILPALEHPETKDDARTWFVAGMVFSKEYDAEMTRQIREQGSDHERKMGRAVLTSLEYFIKADELDSQPDQRGRVRPRYRDDIKRIIKGQYRKALWDYGVFAFEGNDMRTAATAFEALANIQNLPMMQGDKDIEADTEFFAAARENFELATIRQASNQLASSRDTTAYYRTIKGAFDRNPNSKMFLTTLIDYYTTMRQDTNRALELLDKAIVQEPENVVFHLIKGQVLARNGESEKAIAAYARVLELDPNNKEAYTGKALIFITEGDRLGEEANTIRDTNAYNAKIEERKTQFTQAIPLLEKVRSIDPSNIGNLQMLRQLYYNVEGESANYQKITAELEALR